MKTKISSRLQRPGDKILYTYDFGDSWTHIIKLEEIKDLPETTLKCLAGKGACPPEDVGGFPGYEAMKEVFASDPQGDEAQSYREWLGFDENDDWVFDPHEFDTHSANEKLERRVTKRLSRKSADSSEDKLLS